MIMLCLSITLGYLLYSIYKIASWKYVLHWIRNNHCLQDKEAPHVNHYPDIIILIPGLRETSLVESTVSYYSRLEYPKDKLHIVFITTAEEARMKELRRGQVEKLYHKLKNNDELHSLSEVNNGLYPRYLFPEIQEIMESFHKPDERLERLYQLYNALPITGDLIEREIMGYPQMSHLSCPDLKGGGKPTQLNYAVEHLGEVLDMSAFDENNLYIGVYDFDSRPDLRTCLYIAENNERKISANLATPDYYQQTQLPLNNLQLLQSVKHQRPLVLANLVMYTRRALGIELFKFKKLEFFQRSRFRHRLSLLQPSVNGVGAGLFIKPVTLQEVGYFVEPVEDLIMGYRLGVLKKEVEAIPLLNIMEPYFNIASMIHSQSRIFMIGLRLFREKLTVHSAHSFLLAAKEYLEFLVWLLVFPVMAFSYLYLFIAVNLTGAAFLLAITVGIRFYLDSILLLKASRQILRMHKGSMPSQDDLLELSFREQLQMTFVSPLLGIVRFLTAIIGAGKCIGVYLLGIKTVRTKTER
ncbi:hypothetical protein [Paenibacillus sp. FSL R7-0331]|uniref:hypothetical protein n=1 Tax=Paenibacillus sp. FSL R7-0331 TaxID=1536773 RepID=UPI0004F63500|nr:hypothetical protein [Paenibacillus sp. FSL R7-0331]AIQ51307.1 hypothetical protein R70331_07145 [Paenibacillus sp. FSL R7-0331]